KPSAGRTKAAVATAPAPFAVTTMKRRRVTVSPSKAPGMFRSAVYFDFGSLRADATTRRTITTGEGTQTSAGALAPDRPGARLPGGPRGLGVALGVGLRGA